MLDILHAEFYKFKGMFKRYYIDSLAEIVSYLILFVGLSFTILNNHLSTENALFQLIIGIFIWYVGINAIAVFTFILQEEMQLGTLEQIFLTRTSLTKMLCGRAFATFLFDSIGGIVLSCTTIIVVNIFSNSISLSDFIIVNVSWVGVLLVLVLTMIGIYGFAFILAGLSIVYKRISAITVILNYIFLFFTGITLTGNTLPPVLDIVSKILPITWGITNLQNLVIGHSTIQDLVGSNIFLYLVMNSAIYLTVGLFIFKLMLKVSKKDGSLGHY
jgi:ABC-2 type transport system permease protein